jgi:hypothetical protein
MTITEDRSSAHADHDRPTNRGSWLGAVLTAVGVFLIVAGFLAQVYLPGQVKKSPNDTNEITELSGTALLPANFSDPSNLEQAKVKVFQHDKSDQSKSDSDVSVYDQSTCLVLDRGGINGCVSSDDPDARLVNVTTDRFATDRKTGESVNDPKYVGADATPHKGLVNKFPFDVEKKTYQVWDGVVGDAVPAKFAGTEKLLGMEVYKFNTSASAQDVEILPEVQGSYTDEATYYVEPKTGSIVNKTEHQERFIGADQMLLNLDVQFTDKELAQKVDDAKGDVSSLKLLTVTGPIIAYILGALVLVGAFLVGRRRRTS